MACMYQLNQHYSIIRYITLFQNICPPKLLLLDINWAYFPGISQSLFAEQIDQIKHQRSLETKLTKSVTKGRMESPTRNLTTIKNLCRSKFCCTNVLKHVMMPQNWIGIWSRQRSFCVCAQSMKDDVTMQRHLSLTGCIHQMIPARTHRGMVRYCTITFLGIPKIPQWPWELRNIIWMHNVNNLYARGAVSCSYRCSPLQPLSR